MIVDTHVLLWLDRGDDALGSAARQHIDSAWRSGTLAVSAISFWETAILVERGRVELPIPVEAWRGDWLRAGLTEVPLDGGIALAATRLDGLHRDPADRFIVATANALAVPLLTADRLLLSWSGPGERIAADV